MDFDDLAPAIPYLSSRAAITDAADLIARFGDDAGYQAAARADRSRDVGNVQNFAHWRQIERLIALLASEQPVGSIH